MGRKRRQSARLLRSAVPTDNELRSEIRVIAMKAERKRSYTVRAFERSGASTRTACSGNAVFTP